MRWSECTSAHEMRQQRGNYGHRYRWFTASAFAYTDFWAAYAAALPSERHQSVGKETELTRL